MNNTKIDCILVSFDYKKVNSPCPTYAIASLLQYSKEREVNIINYSLDMNNIFSCDDVKNELKKNYSSDVKNITSLAISSYVWSKDYVNYTIKYFLECGFKGQIIIGGYEITYNTQEKLKKEYPNVNIFISNNAEESLFNTIKNKKENHIIFKNEFTDIQKLPLVYSTSAINISKDMKVNFETKRGCPYSCTFCAHRDLNDTAVLERNIEDIKKELIYLQKINIKKINFLDPIFNVGQTYLEIMKFMIEIDFQVLISFQTRFELIKGKKGKEFLNLASKLNIILEFGLQTIIKEEYEIIKRKNERDKVSSLLNELNKLKIMYEVSLIYGLPKQTVTSFIESINFLEEHNCQKIIAYPLMLLVGTKLYFDKEKYNLKEKEINNISYVVSSDSFSEKEYKEMKNIANNYNNDNKRLVL